MLSIYCAMLPRKQLYMFPCNTSLTYSALVTLSKHVLVQLQLVQREDSEEAIVEGRPNLNYFSQNKLTRNLLNAWTVSEFSFSKNMHGQLMRLVESHNQRPTALNRGSAATKNPNKNSNNNKLLTHGCANHSPEKHPVAYELVRDGVNDAFYIITSLSNMLPHPQHFTFVDGTTQVKVTLLCMSASLSFQQISPTARSVILTSGTLKPLQPFWKELGTPFHFVKTLLHVANVHTQLFLAFATKGPAHIPFTATSASSKMPAFRYELANALAQYLRVIANRIMVFLPSYTVLHELHRYWNFSGAWDALLSTNQCVLLEQNKRGTEFDTTLSLYTYASKQPGGTFLFAVYRGKFYECVDLQNEASRAFILIGIPLQYLEHLPDSWKRMWQNRANSVRTDLFSGQHWYYNQGFKALKQALGRVLRHKTDNEPVICVEHRFFNPFLTHKLPYSAFKALTFCHTNHIMFGFDN
ncbi:Fanconi anemia group J protein-like [Gracilariopsis chorda]|uniref:Fanconi anemia group J protein-like n=1 Tax=Gracilariopsis chorda TaxID=448386 RepID=A0A2V3ING8_9FLOR|nr:Fanconi anemia group J protein-like [Gracilariopsis chorda]|eukprot:PXF43631.1 Fanconi anemia group J protein-like [Gracilariopsis chorda]